MVPTPTHVNVVCYIQGREFFSCAKPRDAGSCGHFQWADEVNSGNSFAPGTANIFDVNLDQHILKISRILQNKQWNTYQAKLSPKFFFLTVMCSLQKQG